MSERKKFESVKSVIQKWLRKTEIEANVVETT